MPARASSPASIGLVNGTKEIIADASDHDHGRDGPKQQYWHVRLLLICPQHETPQICHLFPHLRYHARLPLLPPGTEPCPFVACCKTCRWDQTRLPD